MFLINDKVVDIQKFPAGESRIRLSNNWQNDIAVITWKYEKSDDAFDLALIVDCVRNVGFKKVFLELPYIPFARQDRICSFGESNSLKVFSSFLNSLNFDKVSVLDPHSEACNQINNLFVKTQDNLLDELNSQFDLSNYILVVPDEGAKKKVSSFIETHTHVYASKVRNPDTGELSGFKVASESVGDKDFLIVDDICDGGGTFIGLAQELKKLTTGKIDLYVTHCIASKGFKVFDNIIDVVYTANQMCNDDEKLVVINTY